jgi:nitrite reductase/ring-hydroxylating ferredoxin subunit/Fe-S cluster biogenesis protein NfuA
MSFADQQPLSDDEFQEVTRHLDGLVREFEALPYPEIRAKVFDLLASIDTLHRTALNRLAAFINDEGLTSLLERAAQDPAILTLLQLYDVLPLEPQEQVIMALETLRNEATEKGCLIEFLGVTNGIVSLRLSGACQGNSEGAINFRQKIEDTLRAGFRGFIAMEVSEPPTILPPAPGRSIIPLQQLQKSAQQLKRPVFTPALALDDLPPGSVKGVEVEGTRVLLCRVDEEIFAFHNACPGSPLPLDMGQLEGTTLHCPWHQCLFDLHSGRRLDGGHGRLAAIPVTITAGMIQLALKVEPVKR